MGNIDFVWTIFSGLVIGVVANVLTPRVVNLWGKVSDSARQRSNAQKERFKQTVQYFLDNPTDLIQLRNERNSLIIVEWVALVGSVILAFVQTDLIGKLFAAFFAIAALYAFGKSGEYNELIRAIWKQKRQENKKLEMNLW